MTDSIYSAYALFLMQNLSQIMNNGVGMDIDVYPCNDENNTVIQVKLNKNNKSSISVNPKKSFIKVLKDTGVTKFISPVSGIKFEDTNTFVSSDTIVYVKEDVADLFSEDAAADDVLTLVKYMLGKS